LASHVYTTPAVYSFSVIATDANGHSSVPVSTSVSITTVAMETDPYDSSLTALYVGGTLGNDTIAVTPATTMVGVKVGMNFVNYGTFFPTGHVVVYSQSGNDIIKTAAQMINGVFTYVNVPVLFFAGSGTDILNVTGSSANNVLVGGGGNERLLGGQGRDILIGGTGKATLQAGTGGDILIGGTTAYDNNAAALAALLAEWSRTDIDYATRIAHLIGSMSGGLNASCLLNASTVQGNGMADNLYGGPGMDWFFAGMADVMFYRGSGEVVTQI
jgi:Ca2+-binding RTX toxin-like protein